MTKISFDDQHEKRSDSKKKNFENRYDQGFAQYRSKTRSIENRNWGRTGTIKNDLKSDTDFQFKRNNVPGSKNKCQDKLPQWVACVLFSLLGAFAILMPLASTSAPYNGMTLNVSITGIDIIKMELSGTSYLNMNGAAIYLITTIAFAASLAISILMRDRIAERPYVPVMLGIIAIACIFIAFEPSDVINILKRFSICFTVQIASALMLIAMNITPLVKMIEDRHGTASKRKVF